MTAADGPHLDVLELSRRLRAVEPAVRLLPARLMGRVLKHLYQVHGLGWQVPHRHCLVVREKDLLPVVDRVDLDLPPESLSEEVLILIAAPTPEELALLSREAILLRSWRTLFHARVHLALEQQRARGQLTDRDLRERLHQIGPSEVEDIRQVLRQEETLLPPGDDWTVFVEFAAVYLELRHFDQALLPWYFPTLRPFGAIDRLLKEVEGGRLLAATRPEGAPDPNQWAKEVPAADAEEPVRAEEPLPVEPRPEKLGRLLSRAEKARGRGNVVRAALASQRAARWAPSGERDQLRSAARADLDGLAERLQAAVGDVHPEEGAWQQALAPLLEQAAAPGWPVEARLLYDLQKVCFDHERELYAVDLVEWGLSLGRRPLQRPVPCQRAVLLLKHLRSAVGRLKSVRLSTEECWALSSLLVAARKRAQERLRESFRPLVRGTLEEVGMRPGNLPERVAQNKLVEELLDRILERGFLTMGDLRDALSRNRLKLPDLGEEVPAGRKSGWARLPLVGGFLTGLAEFWRGDRLLRANQRLAETLDGVYRRGEIYLRWLQRFSALAFGTHPGRFLTRYLALPFGGAYVLLEGLQHTVGLLIRAATGIRLRFLEWDTIVVPLAGHEFRLLFSPTVAGLGFLFLGLLYVQGFRKQFLAVLWLLYRALRGVLFDVPTFLLHLPPVQKVLQSPPVVFFRRFLLQPLFAATMITLAFRLAGKSDSASLLAGGSAFGLAWLLFNTRLGLELDEAFLDWLARTWKQLNYNLLPGLFRLIMGLSKRFLEGVDQVLYRVDEWLRFRTGDSRLALVLKPLVGLVWFYVTYVVRFFTNLIVEPQINPIKHFPVVTVSHKLVLGLFVHPFAQKLVLYLGMERALADTMALTVGSMIPGIFGFLVWELKENWRLYRANQSPTLTADLIGPHGETLPRFLRPGLHSGTLPKLFPKLRRAEQAHPRLEPWRSAPKYHEALHHVEESLRHFVERQFLFLLNQSRRWGPARVTAGEIDLAPSRIRMEVCCPELGSPGLMVSFEEQAGRLLAGAAAPDWLPKLTADQYQALTDALAGFYKLAGVDLVRPQIEACLGPKVFSYTVTAEGLLVWSGLHSGPDAVYPWAEGEVLRPRPLDGTGLDSYPPVPAAELLFPKVPVSWKDWVEVWEKDQEGQGVSRLALARGWVLLESRPMLVSAAATPVGP